MRELLEPVPAGLALAGISAIYYLVRRAPLAVSGRIGWLLDETTRTRSEEEELILAIREATAQRFGEAAVSKEAATPRKGTTPSRAVSSGEHVLFLVSLGLGGALGARTDHWEWTLGPASAQFWGQNAAFPAVLFFAGVLTGFGSRWARGCNMGHGLIGLSQLQKGSFVSTLGFFAAGMVTSFVMSCVF